MIVEDDQNFHDLYSEILEDTDFRLIHAYDGEEALAKLEDDNKPDLIILDLLLDMMTGDIFLLYLKGMSEYADIPVIVISNFPKRGYKSLRVIEPNLTFFNKTITKEKLIATIETKIREQNFKLAY
jgi:CheY-like chemotaxis protein